MSHNDTVLHFANPPEQAADASHVCAGDMNLMKMTRGFETGGPDGKDANGYPNLTTGAATCKILDIPFVYYNRPPFAGNFRFYWRGGGRMSSNVMADIDTDATTYPSVTIRGGQTWFYQDFSWQPPRPGDNTTYNVRVLSAPATGTLFHDMAIIHQEHISDWESGLNIPPEAVELHSKFQGGLRFMTHLNGNLLTNTGDVEERYVSVDHVNYNKGEHNDNPPGIPRFKPKCWPIERLVEFCNRTGQGLWYTFPVDIIDSRVTSICQYVRDNLNPGLIFYAEYGNELWNSADGFQNYDYCLAQGRAKFPNENQSAQLQMIANWAAYRINQIAQLVETAFSGGSTPVRWIMGASATGATSYGGFLYDAVWARLEPDFNASYAPETLFDYYAVGMYFGGIGGAPAIWVNQRFGSDRYAKALWIWKAYRSGGVNGSTPLGRNAFPKPIGKLDNPQVRTDVPLEHTIYVGRGANSYESKVPGDTTNRQDFLTPPLETPDETTLWRINRTVSPIALQFNMEAWAEETGVTGPNWVTVLTWADGVSPPTLREMSLNAQIYSFGGDDGINGLLDRSQQIRINDHLDNITNWGSSMQLIAYEGGVGDDGTPEDDTGESVDDFIWHMHYGDYSFMMYDIYRLFVEYANIQGVYAIAWYKSISREPWDLDLSNNGRSRGLSQGFPNPKPDILLPDKLKACVGPADPVVEARIAAALA